MTSPAQPAPLAPALAEPDLEFAGLPATAAARRRSMAAQQQAATDTECAPRTRWAVVEGWPEGRAPGSPCTPWPAYGAATRPQPATPAQPAQHAFATTSATTTRPRQKFGHQGFGLALRRRPLQLGPQAAVLRAPGPQAHQGGDARHAGQGVRPEWVVRRLPLGSRPDLGETSWCGG